MTLNKAMELQELETSYPYLPINQDLHDAQKLGIEAMKIVAELRQRFPKMCLGLLPGETEGVPNAAP